MADVRQVIQGVQEQRVGEKISWAFDTAANTSAPVPATPIVYDESDDDRVVTTEVMPAADATASGTVVTMALLQTLVAKHFYRADCVYTGEGNTFKEAVRVYTLG